ncbi:hypothetical protein [Chrysiogenes arsenatis]|uniref:hypothetical protein n=1 Tax=Chrysiogenes arsenatis TaxID=309797 RepID=UPI0004284388|nr:hypothetical protein [Chrysiogenes arsenatis]
MIFRALSQLNLKSAFVMLLVAIAFHQLYSYRLGQAAIPKTLPPSIYFYSLNGEQVHFVRFLGQNFELFLGNITPALLNHCQQRSTDELTLLIPTNFSDIPSFQATYGNATGSCQVLIGTGAMIESFRNTMRIEKTPVILRVDGDFTIVERIYQ